MKRVTTEIPIPPISIGTRSKVLVHDYYPASIDVKNMDKTSLEYYEQDRVYIQASLHADELPGLLVCHHLIKLLDGAAERGQIRKQITIVPYANPIGLNQVIQGKHFGRFSLLTGTNFNRNWMDVADAVAKGVEGQLKCDDAKANTAIIRKALYEEADKITSNKSEVIWKKELYKKACTASVVLDLHCDLTACLYMFTHDRLWPQMADLAASLGTSCNLLASDSGGNAFDESYSDTWSKLIARFPQFPVEVGSHAVTIELRGSDDVYDDLASKDAKNLYSFLVRRGFVEDDSVLALSPDVLASQKGLPYSGTDLMEVTAPGILAWKVNVGDTVKKGDLLGEVVNIEDVDAPRIPFIARVNGIVFSIHHHKLAVPGEDVIAIAGETPLEWRLEGHLMTD
jgi:predicted deacylase